MPKLQHCVYVLVSLKDDKLYIGRTTNLQRRLTEHFHGRADATAPRRPFRLVFCKYFLARPDAERRERYFKTAPGKRALKLMLRSSLSSLSKESPRDESPE